jgi:nucleotide-binding universal stress UspA family protein
MYKKIMVGVDGSRQANKAFEHALNLAAWSGAELQAVAVVHGPDIEMAEPDERQDLVARSRQRLQAILDELRDKAASRNIELNARITEGHPVEKLLELAWNESFDHIVVGHRSKGLFEQLLMGSVAKRVVDFARCTVTVVR